MKKIFGTFLVGASMVTLASCATEEKSVELVINDSINEDEIVAYTSYVTETLSGSTSFDDNATTSNMSYGIFGGAGVISDIEGNEHLDGFSEIIKVDIEFDSSDEVMIEKLIEAYNLGETTDAIDNFDESRTGVTYAGVTYTKASKALVCSANLDDTPTGGHANYWNYNHTTTGFTETTDGTCGDDLFLNEFYRLERSNGDIETFRYVKSDAYLIQEGDDTSTVQLDVLVGHNYDAYGNNSDLSSNGTLQGNDDLDRDLSSRTKLKPYQDGKGYHLEYQYNGSTAGANIEISNNKYYDKVDDTEDTYQYNYQYRIYSNGDNLATFEYSIAEDKTIAETIGVYSSANPVTLDIKFGDTDSTGTYVPLDESSNVISIYRVGSTEVPVDQTANTLVAKFESGESSATVSVNCTDTDSIDSKLTELFDKVITQVNL